MRVGGQRTEEISGGGKLAELDRPGELLGFLVERDPGPTQTPQLPRLFPSDISFIFLPTAHLSYAIPGSDSDSQHLVMQRTNGYRWVKIGRNR